MTSRPHFIRAALLAALTAVSSSAAAAPDKLALWLDGRDAVGLQPAIVAAATPERRLVAAHLVARMLHAARGTIKTLQKRFADGGYKFQDLLVALTETDAFRYRRVGAGGGQ